MVRIDIRNADQLRRAFLDMGSPKCVVVQTFLKGQIEAIAGVIRSPDVGPIMLVVQGGIYAEVRWAESFKARAAVWRSMVVGRPIPPIQRFD